MASLPENYEFGSNEKLTEEQLLEVIKKMYRDLARAINRKSDIVQRTTDGQTTDTFLSNGTININTSTLKVEILTEHTNPAAVVWTQIS